MNMWSIASESIVTCYIESYNQVPRFRFHGHRDELLMLAGEGRGGGSRAGVVEGQEPMQPADRSLSLSIAISSDLCRSLSRALSLSRSLSRALSRAHFLSLSLSLSLPPR